MPSNAIAKRLIFAGSALFLFALWLIFDMYRLHEAEQLWGHRPLWCLLSGWFGKLSILLGIQLLRGRVVNWRHWGLSTLSGLLLGLGFPGYIPFPMVLFVAWVPLLVLFKEGSNSVPYRIRKVLPYVFHTVLLWNIISTYWVMNTAFAAGLFANIVNSLLMCIPWVLWMWVFRVSPRLGFAPLVANWLVFEYIHLRWDLTWAWLNLGNGFAQIPALVQWYEVTGTFGGSLWVWVGNLLFLQAWQRRKQAEKHLTIWVKPVLWVVLPIAASLVIYWTYDEAAHSTAKIDVVVVQPNYEPHFQKFSIPENRQLRKYIELGNQRIDEKVDYLVYPESAFGFVNEQNIWENPLMGILADSYSRYPSLHLVTGLTGFNIIPAGAPTTPSTRRGQRQGVDIQYEVSNMAAQFTPQKEESVQTYRKSKLVPGAESFPYSTLLAFMEPLVNQLGGSVHGLATQPERSVFTNGDIAIGPAICYESIFGEYYTGYIRKGAEAIFIMTNDGWWDNTPGHRQHLYFASLRAIETRRAIARSANTGVSAFINARGDIQQPTKYGEEGVIRQAISLNNAITFYVRWGDFIGRIALLLAVIFVLSTLARSITAYTEKLKKPK